jgi:ABC-2 type transport system ATP-binding protein
MEEAQELADRVAVMARGILVAEGDPDTIGGRDTASARVRFTLPAGTEPGDLPVTPSSVEGRLVTVEVDDPTSVLHHLTGWALDRGTTLADLAVVRPSLEDVYLQLTDGAASVSSGASGPGPEPTAPGRRSLRGRAPGRSSP